MGSFQRFTDNSDLQDVMRQCASDIVKKRPAWHVRWTGDVVHGRWSEEEPVARGLAQFLWRNHASRRQIVVAFAAVLMQHLRPSLGVL